ncbi:ParB N-terminal domain-containing protein [Bradyrhizobium sp. LB11.1]|uniref:ParB/RepB/Spo0J family partition protein n=1 Tax=Bradyrhizobium sp. LB11.1 TaxID=3156326 RepID=UPI00339753B8
MTADINELRARAKALGYSKIDKHGTEYWLIGIDGERTGVEGLDGVAGHLDDVEAIQGGAVRVITTACGVPKYAHDKDGPVSLDDPRVIELLGAECGTAPDFDAMSDKELALHDHRVGNVGMNADQHKRLERAYVRLRKKAEGAQIFSLSGRRLATETLSIQAIDDIHILPGRRTLDENTVVNLMRSIERIGLQSPPSIRFATVMIDGEECDGWPVLVAGRHRLEAMRRLGHMWITCVALNISDIAAELTEISENLHRAELTALQRDEQIARWIELTTIKPEISGDDAKPVQLAQVSGGRGNKGGLSEASRELGVERTDAVRAMKVAALSPEAKAAAKEAGLDDNRSALLAAARADTPSGQVVAIKGWRQKKAEASSVAALTTVVTGVMDAATSSTMLLQRRLTKAKEQLEEKEGQRQSQESRAEIAVKQVRDATSRAMFAEADKERLQAEVDRLTEENAALRTVNDEADARYRELLAFVNEADRETFMAQQQAA